VHGLGMRYLVLLRLEDLPGFEKALDEQLKKRAEKERH